jgi:hypothetical protein
MIMAGKIFKSDLNMYREAMRSKEFLELVHPASGHIAVTEKYHGFLTGWEFRY